MIMKKLMESITMKKMQLKRKLRMQQRQMKLGKKVMERRKVSMSGSHITNLSKNQEINKIVYSRWLKHINRLQ